MDIVEQLIKKYKIRPVHGKKGEERYFSLEQLIQLIEYARIEKLAILGFQGFHLLDDNCFDADTGVIADFSIDNEPDWENQVNYCCDAAEHFILNLPDPDDYLVLIVILITEERRRHLLGEKF